MAGRQRLIYNVLDLYVSSGLATGSHTGSASPVQLSRIQSFDFDFKRNLQDVLQYGNLNRIGYIDSNSPDVTAKYDFYTTNGANENRAGLTVTTGTQLVTAISGLLAGTSDPKNIFCIVADQAYDANGYTQATTGTICVAQASISNYTFNAAVGDLAKSSFDYSALNAAAFAAVNGTNDCPCVDSQGQKITGNPFTIPIGQTNPDGTIAAIQKGDILVSAYSGLFFATGDLKLQSATLTLDLARTPINQLGSSFPVSRPLNVPINATLSLNAEVGDVTDSNLVDLLCQTGNLNLAVTLLTPQCGGNGAAAYRIYFNGATLTDESFTSAVGSNATATFNYSTQLGGASLITGAGVYLSGSYTTY